MTSSSINSAESAQLKKMAKGKQSDFDPKRPKKLTIFITDSFPEWQSKYIDLLKEVWDPATNTQNIDDNALNGRIGKMGEMKKAMPFVQALKKRLKEGEPADVVLARKLVFDEKTTLLVGHLTYHNL
jgi:leucyl-tRNA synthetase